MRIKNGKLELKTQARSVTLDGKQIQLGRFEFDFLKLMTQYNGIVLKRDDLIVTIWEVQHPEEIEARLVTSLVYRVTKKLGQPWFRAIPGYGYTFAPPEGTTTMIDEEFPGENVEYSPIYKAVPSTHAN